MAKSMNRRIGAGRSAMILLSLLALTTGIVFFLQSLNRPHTGLVSGYPEAVHQDGGIYFAPRTPFSPAIAAGMRPYVDRIERVGETTIRSLRDLIQADDSVVDYGPITVVVSRETRGLVSLQIQPVHPFERPDAILRGVFLILLGAVAVLLVAAPRLGVAEASIAGACLTYFVFVAVNPFYYSTTLSNVLTHTGRFTAWLLVAFAAHFPYRRATRAVRSSLATALLLLIVGLVIWRLSYYTRWMETGDDGWFARFRTLGRIANISDAVAYAVFATLTLTAYRATPLSREKRQLEWVLAGFLIAVPPYFFLEQLPLILGDSPATRFSTGALSNLVLLIFPLFFLVGASRGRDIRFRRFLSRYVVVVVMIALTLLCFAVAFPALSGFVERRLSVSRGLSVGLSAVGFVLPLLLLRPAIAWTVDRLFGIHAGESGVSLLSRGYGEKPAEQDLYELFAGLATRLRQALSVIGRRLADLDRIEVDAAERLHHSERQRAEIDIDAISREIQRIRDLAEALDTFGRTPLSLPELCPADRIVDQAIAQATRRIPEIRIRRCGQREQYPYKALAHVVPQRAVAVIAEILVNAHESSPERTIDLSIESDERSCSVSVRDFGGGPPSKHAFRPFVTSKPDRLGLGLTVARRGVEQDGGSLVLSPADPQGTVAIVTYPSTKLPNR